ncbi:SPOR domain-containing protein [bacterium]|nr:SPOR domain-containing protein [bacterium]
MRDLRKFRNKLTFELDNRQIAFLLAGLIAVMAIVFALGIVVGKGLTRMDGGEELMADVREPTEVEPAPFVVTEQDLEGGSMDTGEPAEPVNLLDKPGSPVGTPMPVADEPPPAYEAPSPPPPPSAVAAGSAPTPPTGGGWTVQLSAHPNEAEAKGKQSAYVKKGIEAYIVRADIPGKGVWYRVRVGQFSTREGAQQYANAIREREQVEPYITRIN